MQLEVGDLSRYQDDGHVQVASVLDGEQLEGIRHAFDEAVGARYARTVLGNFDYPVDMLGIRMFTQRFNTWQTNSIMSTFVQSSKMASMVAHLEAIECLRLWRDEALIKHPFADATPLHIDISSWSFDTSHAATVWLALDDVTPTSGGLVYLSGSHKVHVQHPVPAGPAFGAALQAIPEYLDCKAVPISLAAGSVSIHNCRTAHAAFPNIEKTPRRVLVVSYFEDGAVYNGRQHLIPTFLARNLRPGAVLRDDTYFPVVHRHPTTANPGRGLN